MKAKAKDITVIRGGGHSKTSPTHDRATLINLYREITKPRMIEEKMLLLLRQGKVTKWFSGIGQEAIAIGCTLALHSDEFILPLHRNLGVFTARKVPLDRLFLQFQGKEGGFTKGRDRSFHFGTLEYRICGMISHLGPQLCVADGIALADKLSGRGKVTVAFSGEGGTSEGDFHEALNVASVWDLPVIFVVENNGYGLSTPTREQYRCKDIVDRAIGYGMEGVLIDGNNLLEVYDTVSHYAESLRKSPRPVLIECKTFRMRGHEEASGVKYVPKELFVEWEKKDPVKNFEQDLLEKEILDESEIKKIKAEIKAEIEAAIEIAFSAPEIFPSMDVEVNDVYATSNADAVAPSGIKLEKRFVDAISDGLRESLRKFPNLVVMGQDVAEYGGVFKVTEGFLEEFGKDRIRNTPLCESAILGAALGMSLSGYKSVVEMQFSDFVTCGFNQIVNNLAKVNYRWGENADVVVRMPTGGGSAAGPFHSQSTEAWFLNVPGLKIVYPAFPGDAKGLLAASIADPNPVMYFEHKMLYRSVKDLVSDGYYTTEIGKARLVREGTDAVIITYGTGVHWALKAAENSGADVAVLDLRTLLPFDKEAITEIAERTGRVLVLHEATLTGGIGAEIAAYVSERCFKYLDAPVARCASLDTPVPFAPALEQQFMASSRLGSTLEQLLRF